MKGFRQRICFTQTVYAYLSVFLFCVVGSTHAQSTSSLENCKNTIIVGSGSEDGRYYAFISNWSTFLQDKKSGLCIDNRSTKGSVNNLELIQQGVLGFALIQDDIGHNTFYGKRSYKKNNSFSGLKVVFKEYVQVVYRKSADQQFNTISDLQGKIIAAGAPDSGGFRNAMDILNAAGLKNGFHFQTVESDSHALEVLARGKADVAIYTSAGAHKILKTVNAADFEFIELPREASKQLSVVMKKPYYDHGQLIFQRGSTLMEIDTVAVHAYLVTANTTPSALVKKVKLEFDAYLATFNANTRGPDSLEFLDTEVHDLPFDMHYLADESFGNRFWATMLSVWFQVFLAGFAIMIMIGGLYMKRNRYSSIGLIEYNSLIYLIRQRFIVFSQYALGFAFWLFWLWVVASVIVDQEHTFASARGIDSPLEGIGLFERISWLVRTSFTTLPGEIPLSPAASILIPLTVLLGLGAFIYPVVVYFTAKSERDNKKFNGSWGYNTEQDHVIICGWNERVPGVIYSLISEYAPRRKKVVLIAETRDEKPLLSRGFDPKRVLFVRGNAADTSVLKRAGAANASEAIVMACDSKSETKNVTSILSVIALRKLAESDERTQAEHLFIGAELVNPKNKHAFKRAGVDSLVHVDDVADKICAANLLSFGVADFVTDFLTFDDHFEIYSKELSKFPQKFKAMADVELSHDGEEEQEEVVESYDFARMQSIMVSSGLQLIGFTKPVKAVRRDAVVFANNAAENQLCDDQNRLIYFSVRKDKIAKTNWLELDNLSKIPLPELDSVSAGDRLVIIGLPDRTDRIARLLRGKVSDVKQIDVLELLTEASAMDSDDFREELISADSILLLDCNTQAAIDDGQDLNLADCADTVAILLVKFLSDLRLRKQCHFKIIAEVKKHSTREMFRLCGADDIVVRNSLIERLLAKMVFNHGKMYNVVSHLLTLDNGVYISIYEVDQSDPFAGKDIRQLMIGDSKDYQVCGWLPKRMTEYLQLNTMGTASHYITAFNSKTTEQKINENALVEAGDKLVLLRFE